MKAWVTLIAVGLLSGCVVEPPAGDEVPPMDEEARVVPAYDLDVERPFDESKMRTGSWLAPFRVEEPAIHATLLADGRIAYWGGLHSHGPDFSPILASPMDAASRVLTMWGEKPSQVTPSPEDGGGNSDLFCAGQVLLPDGRVLAVSGTVWQTAPQPFFKGSKDVRLFDPATATWTSAPDLKFTRWYPSVLMLPDGRALIASGVDNVYAETMVKELEVFDPATNATTVLPASANRDLPMYPRLYVAPSGPLKGKIFFQPAGCLWCPAGTSPGEAAWNWAQSFDPATNQWTQLGKPVFPARQNPVTAMLALRPPNYDARILTASGTLARSMAPTNTAEITDLTKSPPTHTQIASMAEGRWFANHVLLPDGSVVVVGGSKWDGVLVPGSDANDAAPVLRTEIFEPSADGSSGTWRSLAPMTIPRVYHSTALLLPDGRVWVAGSVPAQLSTPGVERQSEEKNEVFEPPYLFRGPRPVIASAPAATTWGASFTIATPDAASIESVVLMRTGSVTHVYNPEQRLIELVVESRDAGSLTVVAPPDAALAPPGTYQLFLNKDTPKGVVPSVATMLHLG